MTTIRSLRLRSQADQQREAWREFCDRPTATVSILDDEPAPPPVPKLDSGRLSIEESRRVVAQLRAEGKL